MKFKGIQIDTLSKFCSDYDIEFIFSGHQGVPNQLFVAAMGAQFVVPPFRGEVDWEILELKLERYKRGYRREVYRVVFEELSGWQRCILGGWRVLKSLQPKKMEEWKVDKTFRGRSN